MAATETSLQEGDVSKYDPNLGYLCFRFVLGGGGGGEKLEGEQYHSHTEFDCHDGSQDLGQSYS